MLGVRYASHQVAKTEETQHKITPQKRIQEAKQRSSSGVGEITQAQAFRRKKRGVVRKKSAPRLDFGSRDASNSTAPRCVVPRNTLLCFNFTSKPV